MSSEAILRQQSLESTKPGSALDPAVWLARLRVEAFRSYACAELATDGRPVVLTGPNGAGKTNLLEAISFLAPGRGLRRARLAEIEHRTEYEPTNGAGSRARMPWAVAATVVTPDGPRELGTGRDPAAEPNGRERRLIRIDGAPARGQQSLSEILALVWLTPQMDGLFREGATGRRRFLDRLVYGFDPAHAGRVGAYEQALRERARLLRTGQADPAWLSALEEGLAGRGVAIAAARRATVARLAEACAGGTGAFPVAELALAGEVEAWLDEVPALDAEERLRERLAAVRGEDAETGGAALGPHRSDLLVRHVGRDQPAELCSTGEQKALLIAIVLAHARLLAAQRGAPPVLLLDEVAAHLDPARRQALYDEILGLGAQAWLTGTEPAIFAEFGTAAQFIHVGNARLVPASPPAAA
ncbi:MAG TPA: DNA replication/repair protein RecF [Kiloniellales bacterium]|nr:DNA replication/repair protein RecF [Kiloniellales bacterium]